MRYPTDQRTEPVMQAPLENFFHTLIFQHTFRKKRHSEKLQRVSTNERSCHDVRDTFHESQSHAKILWICTRQLQVHN